MKRLLVFLLVASFIPVSFAQAACGITVYQVSVSPPTTGATACYDITFNNQCDIPAGEFLTVAFPRYSRLDLVYEQAIYFDGRQDRFDIIGSSLQIQLTTDLKTGNHKIRVCDVVNPPNLGPHQIFIITKDGTYGSEPFLFKETGVSPPLVEPNPDYVKECAEYTITFNVTSESGKGCHCSRETLFNLEFPVEFELPVDIDPKYVTVNGVPCDYAKVDGHTIVVRSRLTFQAGQQVVIKIDSKAGIKNPKTPGWYRINVYTSVDRIKTPSYPFYIRPSSVTRANVKLDNPYTCSQTGFVLNFSTGPYGDIASGGYIKVYFPEGFTVPKVVETGNIAVNNTEVKQKVSFSPDTIGASTCLSIPIPEAINSSSKVQIVILAGAGIRLPGVYGLHSIDIETSAEPVRVPSQTFTVDRSKITNVSYQAKPSFVTLPAKQVITFKTGGCGGLIPGIDTIAISFPDTMWMPKSFICKAITVNETEITSIPFLTGTTITVPVPKPIDGDSWVTVVIPEDCGIRNPTKAGAGYKVRVWTTREPTPGFSGVTVFSASRLSGVKLEVSKNLVSSRVSAKVQFVTGLAGSLRTGSKISVTFPECFDFRGSVAMMNFSIDGATCRSARWSKPVLELTCSKESNANSAVTIEIDPDAGLTTPENPGQYKISVATEPEPEPVESDDLSINSRPELKISAPKPNEHGWYTEEPVVTIFAFSELDKDLGISIVLDGQKLDFKGMVKIADGYHVLEAVATDAFGNSSEKSVLTFMVDTIAPMFDATQSAFYTNSKSFFKMIRAIDENNLTLTHEGEDGIAFTDSTLSITTINISSAQEKVFRGSLTATDEAGNETIFDFMVTFDWTAPILEIPEKLEISDPGFTLSGKTEAGCELSVKDKIEVANDGSFQARFKVSNGYNSFAFQARDRAGNITKKNLLVIANLEVSLIFEAGKKDMLVNGQKITLKTAPFIEKGSMYVPFDLLVKNCAFKLESWPYSEFTLTSNGGKSTFTHPKKSIEMADGNSTAVVDGELVKMPVAPIMKSGVLYVPLRFTAGLFGLTPVASGKSVKISFMKN